MAQGLAEKIDNIRLKGLLNGSDLAQLFGTRPETVSRWKQGKTHPRSKVERELIDLDCVIEQLAAFYEPNEARVWIFSRQPLLDGQAPADLIREGRMNEVVQLIRQLQDNVYL